MQFGFEIGGNFFEASEENAQKIFAALGVKKVFSATLKLECGVNNLKIAENGIVATIIDMLDYGTEKFLKCSIDENTVYVKSDKKIEGKIHLLPDFEMAGIVETERDIKII